MATTTRTDLNAASAVTLAAALKIDLDRALAAYDHQFGGFRPELGLVGDGKVPTMFVRVRAIATKDNMVNAAGIKARQVCAAHTYMGKTIMVQCISGERYPRYF